MRTRLITCIVFVLLLAGCEENLTDISTSKPFTLHGVLSPHLDRQAIRVLPVQHTLDAVIPEALDAIVASTDLATGEVRVWTPSLFREKDGATTHVFTSDFTAGYGRRYRIEARRSDGETTTVEVDVPPRAAMRPLAGRVESEIRAMAPVLVEGDPPALMEQTNLLRIRTIYKIRAEGSVWEIPVEHFGDQPLRSEGREFSHNLFTDRLLLLTRMGRYHAPNTIELLGLTTRLILGNQEWAPPDNVFDFNVLSQPGVMSNVENGYGFVGAGYWMELDWLPDDAVIIAGGFRLP